MQVLNNNIPRFLIQVFSLLLMITIRNSYGHAAVSIYNRYPVVIIVFALILLYGVFTRSKISAGCEIASYGVLFVLLLYRVLIEMGGFISFNAHLYGGLQYVQFLVGVLLFLAVLLYYFKRIFLLPTKKQAVVR